VFSVNIKKWSLIIDGALLATFFDYIMEPVAINLNFWQWQPPGQGVPFFNYICWFIISAFLIFIFNKLKLKANNLFATDLLIIQTLFFLSLRM
jgi:putative membrane protein